MIPGISKKLLCNNRDALEQRDLDTAAMRAMVLAAMEKKRKAAAEASSGGDGNGNKLDTEEAIQIA